MSPPLNISPVAPFTVITSPVFKTFVAFSVPTIAGIPISRETIAACDVLPPRSVTIALAFFIAGT